MDYHFYNTGLEMDATKRHLEEVEKKYGIKINRVRPKMSIVTSARKYGIPFVSKIMSAGLECVQKKNLPLTIHDEYDQAEDKASKRQELRERYPKAEQGINFLCCCNGAGNVIPTGLLGTIKVNRYVCGRCGHCEEYIEGNDLATLRRKFPRA